MQDNGPTANREEVDFRKILEHVIANPQSVSDLFDLPILEYRLRTICKFSTYNATEAEELYAAMLYKILVKFGGFKPDFKADKYGGFFAWVRVIAKNMTCDNLRRKKFEIRYEPEDFKDLVDPGIGPELAAEHAERDRRFRGFIASLGSERDRKILEYLLEDLSTRRVADRLKAEGIPCSHSTVKNVIDRMRQFLANEDLYFLPRKPGKPSPRGGEPEDKPADKRTDAR